ncbi:hypothetical protein UL82_01545 [Corynebacterium kutscheri]|uniref:Uncharacterized protein n=1 Tax=Corynebacterium kutscheri TaxID=35755 RepID=A0A0F6QYF4_9CORY|nr:hypothetical protein [Corynebacterium kutscheri]AKE40537.1 hypothetical protein UL82_01545 [Corynebacterium kutscheri]VEH10932.1 Uncharacterised protein [Corynebacterium kutscheri]
MHDPTRIPATVRLFEDVWLGQPDLSFAALIGLLENHGVHWGIDDEDASEILKNIATQYPPRLVEPVRNPHIVHISDTRLRILFDAQLAVVLMPNTAPVMWRYVALERVATGMPLRIRGENTSHNYGVVEKIERLNPDEPVLGCFSLLEDETTIYHHGKTIELFRRNRRGYEHEIYHEVEKLKIVVGEPVSFNSATRKYELSKVIGQIAG